LVSFKHASFDPFTAPVWRPGLATADVKICLRLHLRAYILERLSALTYEGMCHMFDELR